MRPVHSLVTAAGRIQQLKRQLERARTTAVTLEQEIEAVRRYATLTLDSNSVERRGMAEDILSLLNPDAESL